MGLIALPVSPHGLSTLHGADDETPDEGEAGSTVDMSAKLRQLQAFLGVEQTGAPNDATRDALKQFQWSHNLPETGALDAETVKALLQAGADLAGLTAWDRWRTYWWAYKWWIIGGAAVIGGGVLVYRSRKKGKK
jgi:hypothetical protein